MKFRAKIKTPWCEKGKIYMAHTYAPGRITYSPNDIPFGYQCVDNPEDYPDLFEPVEERALTPFGKWVRIFERVKNGGAWENLAHKLSIRDQVDVDQIYKEVCGEG